MAKIPVTFTVNGEQQELLVEPNWTLLEMLRDRLRLTGTKEGCSNGNCGACTVLIDGRTACSCLVLAGEADQREVTTVEGLADHGHLTPVQDAFIKDGALQCGFCTPGFLISTTALLRTNPDPSEHDIRLNLAGNLCRCTGYDKIVRAVQNSAAQLRGE
ncbi:MAG: (2Fe-2S)-binding protein [Dehalococcoidia bacterium]